MYICICNKNMHIHLYNISIQTWLLFWLKHVLICSSKRWIWLEIQLNRSITMLNMYRFWANDSSPKKRNWRIQNPTKLLQLQTWKNARNHSWFDSWDHWVHPCLSAIRFSNMGRIGKLPQFFTTFFWTLKHFHSIFGLEYHFGQQFETVLTQYRHHCTT